MISECKISVNFASDAKSVQDISALLAEEPNSFHVIGEKMSKRNPKSQEFLENIWTKNFCFLNTQFQNCLEIVIKYIKEKISVSDGEVVDLNIRIMSTLYSDRQPCSITFSPDLTAFLGSHNILLWVDCHISEED